MFKYSFGSPKAAIPADNLYLMPIIQGGCWSLPIEIVRF